MTSIDEYFENARKEIEEDATYKPTVDEERIEEFRKEFTKETEKDDFYRLKK